MRMSPSFNSGRSPIFRLLTIAVAASIHQGVQSYVVGGGNQNIEASGSGGILSRFTDVRCELQMTVGRTPSTAMPTEWAASGAKLGLPLTLEFSSDDTTSTYHDDTKTSHGEIVADQESLLGEEGQHDGLMLPSFLVKPLNEPSFISSNGQEFVKVAPGRCSCQSSPDTEQYSFRFFLDFPDGAVKNDVSLPAERIYFMTACWNEDDNVIGRAKQWKEDIVCSLQRINTELEEMERRPNPLGMELFRKFRRYATLTERRRNLALQIDVLEEAFPPGHRLVAGPNNVVMLKEGVIAVKRDKGGKEEYHWVGTFKFNSFSAHGGDVAEKGGRNVSNKKE